MTEFYTLLCTITPNKKKREEISLVMFFTDLFHSFMIVSCLHTSFLKVKIFLSPLVIKLNLTLQLYNYFKPVM